MARSNARLLLTLPQVIHLPSFVPLANLDANSFSALTPPMSSPPTLSPLTLIQPRETCT